jgi:hypothetical protein
MVALGVPRGLPQRVDHPREPPADSPPGAEHNPASARRRLHRFRFQLSHSLKNGKVAWLFAIDMGVSGQSDKRDFLSVSLGFLMLENELRSSGWRALGCLDSDFLRASTRCRP